MAGVIFKSFALAGFASAVLLGCSPDQTTTPAELAEKPDASDRAIDAALASRQRPVEDRSDDDLRKPESVLSFIGIEPGMTIFEMEAGRGYYTELFSRLVGPNGQVIMQNPAAFDSFLGDVVEKRLANNRLANVRVSKSPFDDLDAEDASVDIVTWILGPHDLYFTPNGGTSLGDPVETFAEIKRILKPGGTFVVIDHRAAVGSPPTTGGTVHRIDPAIVLNLATEQSFDFVGESDVLHNSDDDYNMNVFDASVRRKTDRFILKFRKPE
ncbi:class I SAM-dependent methyltransferase [Hyphococcus sp. DH-69]|uniref:class I SAM-dependent methyltransferase n=1 Tax=Hyphococcus formosus TaxID=3143534 RepID=UPI00398A8D7A